MIFLVLFNGCVFLIILKMAFNHIDVHKVVFFKYAFNKVSFIKHNASKTVLSKNFYRLYKYMYLQSSSGIRSEELLKSLYRVVSDKHLKPVLMQMSVIISQSSDVQKALNYLKKQYAHEEGIILIGILESFAISGLSKESFLRLDHMLFQKYLSQLREDTRRIKRLYFYAVICFVTAASGVLFLPLIDQMFKAANIIFS